MSETQAVRSLYNSTAWQSFGGFLSQEVNPNLVQIRSSLETLDQASDMCGSAYHWSTGVLFQELQRAASTEQETEVGLRTSEPSGFIGRQLSVVWSNQLTAVGPAEPDGPDSESQPWTATVSPGPGGSLYRDMGKSVCVVVERMKPEYADTVPESISVTGQLRDS